MKGAVCREQEVPCTLEASTVRWPLGFTLMMTSGITRFSLFLKGDVDFDGTVCTVDFVAQQALALSGEPGLLDGVGLEEAVQMGLVAPATLEVVVAHRAGGRVLCGQVAYVAFVGLPSRNSA
jgi:hypothetical protein